MYLNFFTEHFPIYVECMKSTDHNSDYHQEGSVWTHTCMVYAAIKAAHPDNKVLLIAAILHDIGKIKTKVVKDNGKHSFNNHEGVSTFLATDILPMFELTKQEIIDILRIISLHGVCISQLSVPYLSMFRKADCIGRISSKGCLDYDPRNFFTPTKKPEYTVTMLIGLPASGKSTLASSYSNVISRDQFLMDNYAKENEYYNDCYTRVHEDPLLKADLNSKFSSYLYDKAKESKDLIIDMTNLSLSSRRSMMHHFNKAQFKAIVFLPRLSTIETRNACRTGKIISDEILFSMMKNFTIPIYEEGFIDIQYILE